MCNCLLTGNHISIFAFLKGQKQYCTCDHMGGPPVLLSSRQNPLPPHNYTLSCDWQPKPDYLSSFCSGHGNTKSLPVQHTGGRHFVAGRECSSHSASPIGCVLFKPHALHTLADWWLADLGWEARNGKISIYETCSLRVCMHTCMYIHT